MANNIKSIESLAESTEAAGTRTTKAQLQFTPVESSNWLILFSAEVKSSASNDADIAVFFNVNGADKSSIVESCGSTSIDYRNVSGFYYVTGQTAQQTYKIDFNRINTNTASIKNARIVAIRTDVAGADVRYAESLGEATNIGTTYGARATLSFTPATAGDYLVLACCEGRSDDAATSWGARVNQNSGALYVPILTTGIEHYIQEDVNTGVWQPFFAGRVINLAASAQTLAIETVGESGSTADTRAHRIIAIRLSNVYTYGNAQTDTAATNTATTPGVRNTLNTTAPGSVKECLIVATQHNRNSAANASAYGEFEIDDTIVAGNRHEPQDTTDFWSFGVGIYKQVNASQSIKLETTWYGDTTATHTIKNSSITYIEIESASTPVTVTPSVQSVVSSFIAPLIKIGTILLVAAQTALCSVQAPTIAVNAFHAPPAQVITVNQQAPGIKTNSIITPAVQGTSVSIQPPAVKIPITVAPAAQTVSSAFQTPTIKIGVSHSAGAQTASWTIPPPNIIINTLITPPVQATLYSIQPPTISGDANISGSIQTALFSIQAPTVVVGGNIVITPAVQGTSVSIQSPIVTTSGGALITPSAQSIAYSIQSPAISGDANISISVQGVSVSIQSPTIIIPGNIIITPNVQTASISLQTPNIKQGVGINAYIQAITTNLLPPAISTDSLIQPSAQNLIFTILATGAKSYKSFYLKSGRVRP
ncbi:MAG: hypothetical protein UX37_C0016G0002 [Microgenomates group bacterium GW2011_GWA2_46_16]|nr:MAG: hypothetical protein UX37_C0016G0002 [Microgenomates group bacterium GW2011_GWA2_46_16]